MAIWSTTDRLGRLVVLSDAGWQHIYRRHGDTVEDPEMVKAVIQGAERIVADAVYPHRSIHVAALGNPSLPMRVVVHYRPEPPDGTWIGDVVTAFRGRPPKDGGRTQWP